MGSTIWDHDDTIANKSESNWEEQNNDPHCDLPLPFIHLPALLLPSSLGHKNCNERGLAALAELVLQLHIVQANGALHSIHFTLADKVVLFCTEVCHTSNDSANTCTWGKVYQADMVLSRHVKIYRKSQKAMVALQVDKTLLDRYEPLVDQDLKVTAAISDPNGSIHHMADLAWFWTMNIPRDAQESDWMSEFYHINCLCAKAVQDQCIEDVELIKPEVQWTINFFNSKFREWEKLGTQIQEWGAVGLAVYAACQAAIYVNLRDQCPMVMEDVNNSV
ncbi:hypothetical protein PAXRUDRAFT_153734 [Paxillus rubicundulus Ve08.2h10]|uniref:Unplaced genomic scaffold scaffold_801, whole genome shotgun sequence n=1 Tax=Paxillus rubicundulus Ve08.2h10 TaxID=930991 RepID=A0A0D0CII2_9AGAM|nr:hypothetical protein PAXRUDRAFT_153734 [Paxillus rubicundulus Ve08.2h10]